MSSDFVAQIALGPTYITPSEEVIQKAVAKVRSIVEWVRQYDKLQEQHAQEEDLEIALSEMDLDPVQHLINDYPTDKIGKVEAVHHAHDSITASIDTDELVGAAESSVRAFVLFWNNSEKESDCASRTIPGRDGYKVVAAGDMTCGDLPDTAAFALINTASTLGILHFFGIS